MILKDIFKQVDILGPNVGLTLNGSETQKTNGGALLSVIMILAGIFSSVLFITEFLDRSNPTISEHAEQRREGFDVPVVKNRFFPVINIYDLNTGQYISADEVMDIVNPRLHHVLNDTVLNLVFHAVPCRDIIGREDVVDYVSDSDGFSFSLANISQHSVCFSIPTKYEDVLVSNPGDYFNTDSASLLYIRIFPCDLATNSNCATWKLESANINLVFPAYYPQLKNFEKPYLKYFDLSKVIVVYKFSTVTKHFLKPLETRLYDLSQYLGVEEFKYSAMSYEIERTDESFRGTYNDGYPLFYCNSTYIVDNSCEPLYGLLYTHQTKKIVVKRTYSQILDLLSKIGGIFSLLMPIMSFINGVLIGMLKTNDIKMKMFPLIPTKKFVCCCRKKKNRYPTTGEFEGEEIEKNNKHWDGVNDDMNELIEKTMDVSVIFHELSILRVVSRLLLDEKQLELAYITSLHLFRKEKEKEESNEESKDQGQSDRFGHKENDKKRNKSINRLAEAKRSTIRRMKDIRERVEREGGNNLVGQNADSMILEAVNEMKLGLLEAGVRDEIMDQNRRPGETEHDNLGMKDMDNNRMEILGGIGEMEDKAIEGHQINIANREDARSANFNEYGQIHDAPNFQPLEFGR